MSISQLLNELELIVYAEVDGILVVKEDDFTALMCAHALTPGEMGKVHEALDLRRIKVVPYGNEGKLNLCKEILLAFQRASDTLAKSNSDYNADQKHELINCTEKLMSELLQFINRLKTTTENINSSSNTSKKLYSLKKASFGSRTLIIEILEQLECKYHNPNGYTPQEMLDLIVKRGIDISTSKDPHANLRGMLPTMVSKQLYPEYSKAKTKDIVYQPNGKGSGAWRLSKYR